MPRCGMVVDVQVRRLLQLLHRVRDEYPSRLTGTLPAYDGQFWMNHRRRQASTQGSSRTTLPRRTCTTTPSCMGERRAVYQRGDGIVIIDPEKAKGEKDLVQRCPYRVIYWNKEEDVPQKCTFCAHLLDAGWKEPRCVEACPTGALLFGDLDDPNSELSKVWKKAVPMHPEYKLGEKVRFIGLPKNFVAGAVAYGDTDECAKGVTVTLTGEDGTKTVETDAFGDFEFEDLPDNQVYKLTISAPGYKTQELDVRTYKSLYLGDILLQK